MRAPFSPRFFLVRVVKRSAVWSVSIGGRNPPRQFWEREEKAFSESPSQHPLSCGADTVPSFLLGAGEAVVGDLNGMFKDFDGIEGIEQFGFADKG